MLLMKFPPTMGFRNRDDAQKVQHLQDLCLRCIGKHLDTIPTVSRYLAPRFKELLFQQLVNHDCLTPGYLPHITYNVFSAAMTRIQLDSCDQVTDALLKTLSQTACKLEWINIYYCVNITDEGIRMLTKDQQELSRLELIRLTRMTDKALVTINSPVLDWVDFKGCTSITSVGVRDLVKRNTSIRMLRLTACDGLDAKVVANIASSLKDKLEVLDLTALTCVRDEGLIALAESCPNLKMLGIHGACRVQNQAANVLFEHCQELRSLDLSYCTNIIESLRILPEHLQELSVCGIPVLDEDLFVTAISRLQNLTLVRLCGVSALNDNTLTAILSKIGKNLINVDLSGSVMSTLTDVGLAAIARYCTQLEKLALSLIRDVTGASLIPMFRDETRANAVTCLLLSCKKLSAELVEVVASNCHNLEALNIAGLPFVDDRVLEQLAENCPLLNHINLKGCRNVTDEGMIPLARRCPLHYCILSGVHQVTDRTIFALANSCPYLEELHLNGCAHISPDAVEYLKDQCIPRVWSTHKTPNAGGEHLIHSLGTVSLMLPPAH